MSYAANLAKDRDEYRVIAHGLYRLNAELLEALKALADPTAKWQNAPHDLLRTARAAIARSEFVR